MDSENLTLVTFVIDDRSFALPLKHVERVIRAVEITPVPDTGEIVYGVFNLHGEIIPVINLRKRFHFDSKPVVPDDRFLIVNTPKRKLSFVVDKIHEIKNVSENSLTKVDLSSAKITTAELIEPESGHSWFYKDNTGVFVILDVEALITSNLEEEIIKALTLNKNQS